MRVELLTVGHGTARREELGSLVRGSGAGLVVDVPRFPGSHHNPDVARDALADWLPAAGVPSPDTWWRVETFRAYAAYMRTEEFGRAFADLLAGLATTPTIVMCSETRWWRCHRRRISDVAVLLHGVAVGHLGHDGTLSPHRPSEGARVAGGQLFHDRIGTNPDEE